MPAPATALSILMLLSQSPVQGAPEVHKAACRVIIDGVCRADIAVPQAGKGGNGGSNTNVYNFYLGGKAGDGGDGGNVTSRKPSGTASIAPPPTSSSSSPVLPGPPVSLTLTRCKLTIAGKSEVDAKGCKYEKVVQSFTVTAPSENQKYVYAIKVALNEDKTGTGSLSGGRTSAVRSLGTLVRRGACWASEDASVEICAWK